MPCVSVAQRRESRCKRRQLAVQQRCAARLSRLGCKAHHVGGAAPGSDHCMGSKMHMC